MFTRLLVKQLKHPSGLFGRYVLTAIWNRHNAPLNDGALIRLGLSENDQVLDVGFGGGYLLGKMLAKVTSGHVSGIDASALMVEHCCRKFKRQIDAGRLDLHRALVDSIPYPEGHFRKVSSVNSLFFWPDVSRGIREIRRVLAPGGLLVLAYTCKRDLDKRGLPSPGMRAFTDDEVTRPLQEEGFRDILVEHEGNESRSFSIVTAKKWAHLRFGAKDAVRCLDSRVIPAEEPVSRAHGAQLQIQVRPIHVFCSRPP